MKTGTYRKATAAEQTAWANAPMPSDPTLRLNLYELRGYLQVGGTELPVEKTTDGLWEVHAPDGQHFAPDGLHTVLGDGLSDLEQRLESMDLECCSEECE